MRKSFYIVLCLAFIFCAIPIICAQSDEVELNQAELLKQFIGTWYGEVGEDTVVILNIVFKDGALAVTREVRIKEEVVNSFHGMYGFSQDKKTIIFAGVYEDGSMAFDYGQFISEKKYVAEMYLDNTTHPVALEETEFQSPGSFTIRSKWRGGKMTWDVDWSPTWTFNKAEI